MARAAPISPQQLRDSDSSSYRARSSSPRTSRKVSGGRYQKEAFDPKVWTESLFTRSTKTVTTEWSVQIIPPPSPSECCAACTQAVPQGRICGSEAV